MLVFPPLSFYQVPVQQRFSIPQESAQSGNIYSPDWLAMSCNSTTNGTHEQCYLYIKIIKENNVQYNIYIVAVYKKKNLMAEITCEYTMPFISELTRTFM
jgi:hypothetical protein